MPVDYNILSRLNPPFNAIDSLARMYKLRSMQLGNQSDAQAIQLNQQKLDEIARQNQERSTLNNAARNAYQTPAPVTTQMPGIDVGGVNIPGRTSTVQGPAQFNRGAYTAALPPDMRMQAESQFAAQDAASAKAGLDLREQLQKLSKNDLEMGVKKLHTAGQVLGAALQADPQVRPQVYAQGVRQLKSMGFIDPNHPEQYPGDAAVQSELYSAMDAMQQFTVAHNNATAAETNRHNLATENKPRQLVPGVDVPFSPAVENQKARIAKAGKADTFGNETLTPQQQDLVDQIGQGKMPLTRLDYLATRNPGLLAAVSARYPDFDGAKVKSYVDATKDFTSGKTAVQINAGATALGHLQELRDLNTAASHIAHTPAWTRYQNKVDTLATELAKFYGDATIPAINAIKETLGSTLPGNRDAAIQTQAQSMGDKLDAFEQQWRNAAPSGKYQAPMPGISARARAARAELAGQVAPTSTQDSGWGTQFGGSLHQ